ncbi:hypothetical protein ALI22I_29375 [Saccharothrix sp. ALI-22-I]|uniref:antibiotic biosynthesis monooxygenase family protein n=1 Tax=Saccharothrix sp. ALI-22-I TaxID=1933778 RepID=UPI00097BFE12|nr:hypothetical protein [Saccharothrix sp. ALI-22-I]ONI84652.1 hypothetical protein ALI22I_29375 [Saccharothrix sp. ALI-22-I]
MSVVENIRFRLIDGVTEADFRERDKKVHFEYMAQQPGFVSRWSSVSAEGEWFVVVLWATPEDAQATINGFFGAPETQEFLAAVDKTTVAAGSYTLVNQS